MKKTLFKTVVSISLIVSGLCYGENPDLDIKTQLQQKLSKLETYSASFNQVVTDGLGEELQSAEGKIYLSQPQKLYWESFEPNEIVLIADGKTVWHVDPFVEQVIAIDQAEAANNHPIMLLAQTESPQWLDYTVSVNEEGTYLLTSNNESSDFVSLQLTFANDQLTGLKIVDKMQQTNALRFDNIMQNIELDPASFRFSLPDGFELDDQRQTPL